MEFIEAFLKEHPIQKLTVNTTQGEYIVGGKGKIGFVIFPGAGQDAASSFDLIDGFENKFKTISFSYKGFYDLDSFFEFVNSVLVKEKVQKVVLYGLSLGGFLAQHYARKYKNKVTKLIISHSSSTKSKSTMEKLIRPGKLAYFFLPVIPLSLLTFLIANFAGKFQTKSSDIEALYERYSSKVNRERRVAHLKKHGYRYINKDYLTSLYKITEDMQKKENLWKDSDMKNWSHNILILKTDNDPLAQDDGMFKLYYPKAKIYTFHETGHITPFIQFNKMKSIIDNFIENK